ncbi:MAG TPA: DUF6766 family protein [Gaiellaceae bacterium]|jgi:hypothetical protein|nr:DUF6766 family protein [Gaiellaceae bacterium]
MRRVLRENGLSIFFFTIFLGTLCGQSLAGWRVHNQEQAAHGQPEIGWSRYVVSSDFGSNVLENWQSEWLQFWIFALATVWLVQKGSNESKQPDEAGLEEDSKQKVKGYAPDNAPRWAKARDWRLTVYSNSFVLVMGAVFLATWLAQSFASWTFFNQEQEEHEEPTVSWATYVTSADFWERSLQNWQSEFLAVGTMVVFTIYLRQRGSPESKPVGAPHAETGTSG